MFDIELLRTFITVAELRSFTRASAQLHLTQSTISQHIKRLEIITKQPLFDRTMRQIKLTEAGDRLFGYAKRILLLDQEAWETLQQSGGDRIIRIGAPEDFATYRLLTALSELRLAYPRIRFEVTVGLTRNLLSMHEHGELDFVVIKQKPGQGGISVRPEPLAWVDSLNHPIAHERPLPLVVFPTNALFRDDMFRILDSIGRPWRICFSSTSLSNIQSAVSHGIGVSLIPHSAVLPTHRVLDATQDFSAAPAMEIAIYHHADADQVTRFLIDRLIAANAQPGSKAPSNKKDVEKDKIHGHISGVVPMDAMTSVASRRPAVTLE